MTLHVPSVPVVDTQVAAYNAGDLNAFLDCFAHDAVMRGPDGTETGRGRDFLAAAYGAFFEADPDLRAEIVGRLVEGDLVVDQELVTTAQGPLRAIVAYQLLEGRITSMTTLTGLPG